jgi:hypothetical protein
LAVETIPDVVRSTEEQFLHQDRNNQTIHSSSTSDPILRTCVAVLDGLSRVDTFVTFGFVLLPLSLDVPGAKALMVGVVAGEMTKLKTPCLIVAARNEMDLLEIAHPRQRSIL